MASPARSGVLIYAKDVERLATFYETVLGISRAHDSPELVVLESPETQLVLHGVSAKIVHSIFITTPPARREQSALKAFFAVESISAARIAVAQLGGEVFEDEFSARGFNACNACDPEGNIFQVRENA
ncbi:MAG TPA: VOC family protein [Thermoanaerobaculia bacterium]|jgi:predicted enzyme related to lactoylglutathione lyase|nr:VOC family protein [Thermoanaerobaculia bacterium]